MGTKFGLPLKNKALNYTVNITAHRPIKSSPLFKSAISTSRKQ